MGREYKLGQGVLGAPYWERKGDQYRVVNLLPVNPTLEGGKQAFGRLPAGLNGDLIARVIDDRNTPNLDAVWDPKPFPGKAAIGEEVILGTGELFTELLDRKPRLVGVRPPGEHDSQLLSTVSVWHSEVELIFREGGGSR